MTGPAWVLLAATVVVAVTDWVAVARSIIKLEYVAKPSVMVGLIALALALKPANPNERGFFVVALVFGLISDVFLMLPRDLFIAGLGAALVEHLAYITGFRFRSLHLGHLIVSAAIALLSVAVIYAPLDRSLRRDHPRLVAPVIAYITIFVVMVASAGGSGSLLALAGALSFFYSDAILAWNRFVRPLPHGRVINIVPYHIGEALLVLSLAS